MRALARPVSGADDALTSITCGRPAPYGAASYGGAAYGEGVSGGDGGVQRHLGVRTGPSERFRRSGRDRRGERNPGTRQAQVNLLAAADPANAYGAPCRGLRSRTRRRAATGPAGRRERWSSWPTAS